MRNQTIQSTMGASGSLGIKVFRAGGNDTTPTPDGQPFRKVLRNAIPWGNSKEVNRYRRLNLIHLWRGFWRIMAAKTLRIPHFYGVVTAKIIRANGETVNLGVISLRVITNAGVGFIRDAFTNTVEAELMKFHGYGTGATAEAVGDTALVTELTTQYATDNVRPTGSQTTNGANVYRTIGTLAPDANVAITEHGIFSQAATGGGVLLDRSLFSVINLVPGDSLQTTYDATFAAGG